MKNFAGDAQRAEAAHYPKRHLLQPEHVGNQVAQPRDLVAQSNVECVELVAHTNVECIKLVAQVLVYCIDLLVQCIELAEQPRVCPRSYRTSFRNSSCPLRRQLR